MKFSSKINNLLNELELLRKQGRFPNIERGTGELLYRLIVENNYQSIFEIGACNGYSTMWLALGVKHNKGKVITTEWGKDKYKWLLETIAKSGLDKYIVPLNVDARNALKETTNLYDFVFIDGMARLYLEYFKLLEDKLLPNATIVVDNVISHKEKLQDFLDYVKINTNYDSKYTDAKKGVLILKKIK